MRLAHLSDFHFTHLTWNPFRLFSKRILGNLNWVLFRKETFAPAQCHPLPSLLQELGVDLVLFGGDFTTTALPLEFEEARRFANQVRAKSISVPGNHDQYTYRAYRKGRYYDYFASSKLQTEGLEVHPLSPDWTLITLDTTRATPWSSSAGLFSPQLEEKLEQTLQQLPSTQSIILLTHYPFFQNDIPKHCLQRGQALEQLLRRHPQVRLYLHGHTHRHIVVDLQASGLPLILDSGSVTHKTQGSWNLIDLTPTCCTVTPYRWNNGWTPSPPQHIQWI